MVKKRKRVTKEKKVLEIKELKPVGKPWFRKRRGLFSKDSGWGWIPISLGGWISLILLISLNVFSAYYFDIDMVEGNFLAFGSVFLLSIFVFLIIAAKKTRR